MLATVLCFSAVSNAAGHPLDPLSREEIGTLLQILRSQHKVDSNSRFPLVALREPAKEEVLEYTPGAPVRREGLAVVYEREMNKTYEAIVDLTHHVLVSWKEVPGVQPSMLPEETQLTEDIVRADPEWQAAMRKRGIADFGNVRVGLWTAGVYGLPDEEGRRMVRAVSYYSPGSSNFYARPIGGVTAYVDLNTKRVFKLIDTGVVEVPSKADDLDENAIGRTRQVPKPLKIVQPQGSSFEIHGNEVVWQSWHFRFAMHPRDGLVLYSVRYEDHGKLRSILYRAALSELVVPYSDPDQGWFFRNAFDEGEDSLGHLADSLEPSIDAPENARFFDADLADERGTPITVPRAVALYERDGGLLWKHVDERTGKNQSRRARELLLSWIASDGNYEYGFNWIFRQDASLEMEVLLTGILQPKGVNRVRDDVADHMRHGQLVSEHIEAVNHQHFLNFRLDMDVDGRSNSVVEVDTVPISPGTDNPYGGAFVTKETVLKTELEGARQLSAATSRTWEIISAKNKNAFGQPVGYMLDPGGNAVSYSSQDSWLRKRAGFLNAHLWVTHYDPAQMYAAGEYVNLNKGGDGLPRWVRNDRPIEGQDIVLWYTLGITHITRPEEWPVMAVHRGGFKLIPCGFFIRNPALDVPRAK